MVGGFMKKFPESFAKVKIDNEEMLIMKESDILGIIS